MEHSIKLKIEIDGKVLYSRQDNLYKINIVLFLLVCINNINNLLRRGLYKNKNLKKAINDGEFNGWEGIFI